MHLTSAEILTVVLIGVPSFIMFAWQAHDRMKAKGTSEGDRDAKINALNGAIEHLGAQIARLDERIDKLFELKGG